MFVRTLLIATLLPCSLAHATYSLLVADTQSGALGSVGTSCVGSFAVSQISGIAPGFGAIHAQAQSNTGGRDRGVMMLKAGASAQEVVAAITAPTFDLLAASRQYGVVTLDGTSDGFTGASNMRYAEDRQTKFGDYVTSYQGNILTSAKVLDQIASSLEQTSCDLPEALMRALEAGAANGEGDSRCTRNGIPADAGFLRVVARDGSELIAIEVTSQSREGAVVALRERFDAWRATHPCALDAGVLDAALPQAVLDAATPDDAATPRDAALPLDAATLRDAATIPSVRDAGPTRRDATPDQEARSEGCAVNANAGSLAWVLAGLLALGRRRRAHPGCKGEARTRRTRERPL